MKGEWFICAGCGKLAWMEQWLIDEKMALGYKLVCSHECGKKFTSTSRFVVHEGELQIIKRGE